MLLVSRDKRLTGPQKVAIGNLLPGKFFFSISVKLVDFWRRESRKEPSTDILIAENFSRSRQNLVTKNCAKKTSNFKLYSHFAFV